MSFSDSLAFEGHAHPPVQAFMPPGYAGQRNAIDELGGCMQIDIFGLIRDVLEGPESVTSVSDEEGASGGQNSLCRRGVCMGRAADVVVRNWILAKVKQDVEIVELAPNGLSLPSPPVCEECESRNLPESSRSKRG
jgi:hypothetical protein